MGESGEAFRLRAGLGILGGGGAGARLVAASHGAAGRRALPGEKGGGAGASRSQGDRGVTTAPTVGGAERWGAAGGRESRRGGPPRPTEVLEEALEEGVEVFAGLGGPEVDGGHDGAV
jgi:hypothetical protein